MNSIENNSTDDTRNDSNADRYSQVEREDTGTRKEYENNMHRTYAYKNRGLEIKIDTMEILYNNLKMLAEDSQELQDENTYRSLEIMAQLGQAILQD